MFSKIRLKCKTYYKQPSKYLLKMNVNLTAKVSKTSLKHIEEEQHAKPYTKPWIY